MMELTEIVCPHVALPVVGVLVCAVLVFAFGFKSPGQPPSFDFDDKKKIRRAKQKSSKSHTGNGHVPVSVEDVSSKTSTGGKSPRSTASSTAGNKNSSPTATKPSPSSKQDSKKVVKKTQAPKVVVGETKAKAESPPDADEEGWMTQVSKKGKKQRGKKDEPEATDKKPLKEDIADSPVTEVKEAEVTPAETGSPPLEKRKKKSRKTSKGAPEEMATTGGSGEPAQAPVEEQPKVNMTAAGDPQPEPVLQTETKPESTEEQPEEIVEENAPKPPKKTRSKKKEIDADFEIPDVYSKPQVVEQPEPAVTKPAKSPKKNKKDKKQDRQVTVEMAADALVEDLTTNTNSAEKALSEAMQDIPAVQEASPIESPTPPIPGVHEGSTVESTTQPAPSSTAQSTENVTFDELGDSWIEAKVKTKKKKARREN